MFTFSDTFVPATQYVAELEHATWVAALDETEHDWTRDSADFAPDEEPEAWWLDLTPPPMSDEDEHMLVNHYRGI